MDINKVMLIGNLVRDPKVTQTAGDKKVVNFSLATNASQKETKSGEVKKSVEYHDLVAFGRLADVIAQYVTKGQKIYAEGKLRTRAWTDKAGIKHRTTEIMCDNLIMLSREKGSAAPAVASSEEVLA